MKAEAEQEKFELCELELPCWWSVVALVVPRNQFGLWQLYEQLLAQTLLQILLLELQKKMQQHLNTSEKEKGEQQNHQMEEIEV